MCTIFFDWPSPADGLFQSLRCFFKFYSLNPGDFLLFSLQDLEDALMISGGQEESRFLADLHARLLRGLFSKKADIKYVVFVFIYLEDEIIFHP